MVWHVDSVLLEYTHMKGSHTRVNIVYSKLDSDLECIRAAR